MKYLLLTGFLLFIYSCSNKKDSEKGSTIKLKDSLQAVSDTFNTQDLDLYPSLQSDITLDTINIPANKRHMEGKIVFPKLSKRVYPEVYKKLNRLIENKEKDFYEMTKDDELEYDSVMESYAGWGMWIDPKSLYLKRNLLSFAIENGEYYPGTPAGFEYNVINYDLEKKKQITLKDYFALNTSSDTSYLEKLIGRMMNRDFDIKSRTGFLGQINFSFDDQYIYFYIDKYDVLGFGIFSINKKYILDHINPVYR